PEHARESLIPALKEHLAPELDDFLTIPQTGARAVTRALIDRVLRVRAGHFSAVSAPTNTGPRDGGHEWLGPVFQQLPTDAGHWGAPYFEHLLKPLRHSPPGYVLEIDSDEFDADRLASNMPDNVAGIVVVRLP
ncbi:MAG: hypothetical protein WA317_00745, partial [Mycobacterium sp.]